MFTLPHLIIDSLMRNKGMNGSNEWMFTINGSSAFLTLLELNKDSLDSLILWMMRMRV